MNIFDILGPVMVGPSSSHTAGAVRIGLIARKMLGETPARAEIYLHGSFADTGAGHGTDRAIVAGLLGMEPDDGRISRSYEIAGELGMAFKMERVELRDAHPNTALLTLHTESGVTLEVQASSIGGGRIRIDRLNGIDVNFSGESNTLIVHNQDKPGLVSEVTSILSVCKLNIATLQLFRDKCGGSAVMIIELDDTLPAEAVSLIGQMDGVDRAIYIHVKD